MTAKKFIAVAVILVAGVGWFLQRPGESPTALAQPQAQAAPASVERFGDRDNGRMILVQGTVGRVLADDRDGSPHQRFVIRVASGQTLLVAHNLALAERLDGLREGDSVTVHGQYEWNDKGGVIHWTHDDPDGQHAAGYVDWNGRRYQ